MSKISFRKIDVTEEKIFLDNVYLGKVKRDLWNQKWSMHPIFSHKHSRHTHASELYFSAYEAGKAMADLYDKLFNNNKKRDPLGDTDEFFMGDILKDWSP